MAADPMSGPGRVRRALVVRGGWEGHQPVETSELFIPFLADHGFDVTVHDGPAVYTDAATMAATDLVVQCVTLGTIDRAEVAGLRAAVETGTGLAGWHGGLVDAYLDITYLHLVGAQFVAHPGEGGTGFSRHRIEFLPAAADHPVTAGLADFDLHTEQYWVLADSLNDVLATTTQAARPDDPWHRPVVSPAVWTRRWGAGRIFTATPGHDVETLRHPVVETLVRRGLLWAARA